MIFPLRCCLQAFPNVLLFICSVMLQLRVLLQPVLQSVNIKGNFDTVPNGIHPAKNRKKSNMNVLLTPQIMQMHVPCIQIHLFIRSHIVHPPFQTCEMLSLNTFYSPINT